MTTFSVAVVSAEIEGLTLYDVIASGLDRDRAIEIAVREHATNGRHVRVVVDGRYYDTADYGTRPSGYTPRSRLAKLVPGVPVSRST